MSTQPRAADRSRLPAPVRAYPERYRAGDLDVAMEVTFETYDGIVFGLGEPRYVAGECGTWRIKVTNRHADLPAGTLFALIRFNCQFANKFQTTHPRKRDYCTLEPESEAALDLVIGRDQVNLLTVVVASGVFRVGDSFTLRLGDRRGGGAGSEIFWSTTTGQLLLAVSVDGGESFRGVRTNPYEFEVVAHPEPRLLQVLGPTVAAVNEPFDLHLAIFDRNRNVIPSFSGTVRLGHAGGSSGRPAGGLAAVGLPETVRFSPEERGVKILGGVSFSKPGVYRVRAAADGLPGEFLSNPIVVEENPVRRIYWGDVHQHGWGDSTMHLMHVRTRKLDPLARHRQGREIGRFDFSCPAAMSMPVDGAEAVWEAYREACAQTEAPGRYIPFLAYEAHPDEGDRQVFFRNWEQEPLPVPMRSPMKEVDERYGDRDDCMLEVHIGGAPPRWDQYRPDRERMLEVCSGFGCAEWLLQRALRLGYRPAVCAASDLHLGLSGGPRALETFRGRFGQKFPMNQRDTSYGQGPVTAVVAGALTRDALWEAMRARRTYGVSGARIYLDFRCNGAPGGAETALGDALHVALVVHACAPIDRIDLIAGDRRLHAWQPRALDFRGEVTFAAGEVPGTWVYVRIQQVDGEYAWSTPVWLERPGAPPERGDLPAWNDAPPIDLGEAGKRAAERYLPDLVRYLATEEEIGRFHNLRPVGVLELSMGRCALFYCEYGDERLPMSIRWFFEFAIPKIRYDWGWRDFGAGDEFELGPKLRAKYGGS